MFGYLKILIIFATDSARNVVSKIIGYELAFAIFFVSETWRISTDK